MQLRKEFLKSIFVAPEFWRPNRYTGLPDRLDTSLRFTGSKTAVDIVTDC